MTNRLVARPFGTAGLYEIIRRPLSDDRGVFSRLWGAQDLDEQIWPWPVAQVNHSYTSKGGTVRGIHFQTPPLGEAKLVSCLKGTLWDVAVDLRKDSETYLQYFALELSATKSNALLIPPGFGHGFQTLTDDVELVYVHSQPYRAQAESGVFPLDKTIGIPWPRELEAISARDHALPRIDSGFEGLTMGAPDGLS
jgi:dTDP-4-dehydrorhamnose 3,5-epimerase